MHCTTTARPEDRPGGSRSVRTVSALTVAVAVLLTPSAAWAHVTVQPGAVEGGGFSVVSFRVPTERDDASTTEVRVLLPREQPIGSVRTRPVPGWKVTTEDRTLDEPIDMFGEEVDSVVSEVTWTATGKGIAPGQFEDFDVSLGPLPDSGEMVFTAIQTYSSGEVVKWNEVAVDESVEPEHPAPVLTITAPSGEEGTAETADVAETAAGDDDTVETVVPLVLSGLALVVAAIALGLAGRRRV